ncbi:MAG: hypothetical protein LUE98_12440 [Tannerellaceae bacterium]|nr:hypothetical protein [Tannerellaceae bacterium]MCD8178175.1 hypothetical protein [Tannerellaceae bacterium]
MARRKLSNSQIACIILLWGALCYLLLTHAVLDFTTIFSIIASGIIVFVPIYKNIRDRNE